MSSPPIRHGTEDTEEHVLQASAAVARGTSLAEGGQLEAAVQQFTSAARLLDGRPAELAQALLKRSAALLRHSAELRARPAVASERFGALFGSDPTLLVEMSLKDARKAGMLQPAASGPALAAASALLAVSRLDEAEDACTEGLLLEPGSAALRALLEEVRGQLAAAAGGGAAPKGTKRRRALTEAVADETDCVLCARLLYEPVTTSCGE